MIKLNSNWCMVFFVICLLILAAGITGAALYDKKVTKGLKKCNETNCEYVCHPDEFYNMPYDKRIDCEYDSDCKDLGLTGDYGCNRNIDIKEKYAHVAAAGAGAAGSNSSKSKYNTCASIKNYKCKPEGWIMVLSIIAIVLGFFGCLGFLSLWYIRRPIPELSITRGVQNHNTESDSAESDSAEPGSERGSESSSLKRYR